MMTTAHATPGGDGFLARRKTALGLTHQTGAEADLNDSNYVNSNDGYRRWLKESFNNFNKSPRGS